MAHSNQDWDHELPPGDAPSSEELRQLIAPFESETLDAFNKENMTPDSGTPITFPVAEALLITYARPATSEEVKSYSEMARKNRRYRIIKYVVAFSIATLLWLLACGLGIALYNG